MKISILMKKIVTKHLNEIDFIEEGDKVSKLLRTKYDSGCIACEDCYNNCPNGAIYMEGKHAVIDPVVCEDCNMCQYVCSHNIIKAQEVPEHIYKQRKAMELEEGGYWL